MIGSLLDEVFRRHYRGRYQVKVSPGAPRQAPPPPEDAPAAGGVDADQSEVDPLFLKSRSKPRFIQQNIL